MRLLLDQLLHYGRVLAGHRHGRAHGQQPFKRTLYEGVLLPVHCVQTGRELPLRFIGNTGNFGEGIDHFFLDETGFMRHRQESHVHRVAMVDPAGVSAA
jgi:hypothetical protein